MRNFFSVATYNITHPRVKLLLDRIKLTSITESMLDFKIRSKLFLSFSEAVFHSEEDFDKKMDMLYQGGEEQPTVKGITVMNPAFSINSSIKGIEAFSGEWDENCCGAVFMCESSEQDDEEDNGIPATWMFKYEIFYVDDAIELSKNGDFAFDASNINPRNFTSTYH